MEFEYIEREESPQVSLIKSFRSKCELQIYERMREFSERLTTDLSAGLSWNEIKLKYQIAGETRPITLEQVQLVSAVFDKFIREAMCDVIDSMRNVPGRKSFGFTEDEEFAFKRLTRAFGGTFAIERAMG